MAHLSCRPRGFEVEVALSWDHSKRALAQAYACALASGNGHAAGVAA